MKGGVEWNVAPEDAGGVDTDTDWRIAVARLDAKDTAQQAELDRHGRILDTLITTPMALVGLQEAVRDLRHDMNSRFETMDRLAKEAAQVRLQRWSLIVATVGISSGLLGAIVTILRALGR